MGANRMKGRTFEMSPLRMRGARVPPSVAFREAVSEEYIQLARKMQAEPKTRRMQQSVPRPADDDFSPVNIAERSAIHNSQGMDALLDALPSSTPDALKIFFQGHPELLPVLWDIEKTIPTVFPEPRKIDYSVSQDPDDAIPYVYIRVSPSTPDVKEFKAKFPEFLNARHKLSDYIHSRYDDDTLIWFVV
jgi:hypothetical protein